MRKKWVAVLVVAMGCNNSGGGGSSAAAIAPVTSASPGVPGDLASLAAAAGVKPLSAPVADPAPMVALGRALFFDKVLSGNKNISCATCHAPAQATGDAIPVSIGEGGSGSGPKRVLGAGSIIARNAQPLWNAGAAGMDAMFWDSRVHRNGVTGELRTPELLIDGPTPSRPKIAAQLTSALAAQAMFPVVTIEEMRGVPGTNEVANAITNEDAWTAIMARLGKIPAYTTLFGAAYPGVAFGDLNFGHAARAIAAFERQSFKATNTPFDRWLAGDPNALSDAQKRGGVLFFSTARCSTCHSGPLLTDLAHHALATPQLGPGKFEAHEDRGRALITGDVTDNYKFRTPALRNVATSGPWMHDGAFTTLEGAVRHHLDPARSIRGYNANALAPLFATTLDRDPNRINARVAAIDKALQAPLALSDPEVADVLEFLKALNDDNAIANLRTLAPSTVPSGLPVPD